MLRHEVEKKLGLTRKAIEYYEYKGLISPKRDENGYKKYEEEELSILEKISLYRKLGFSLGEIGGLIENNRNIERNLLRDYKEKLKFQEKRLEIIEKHFKGQSLESIKTDIDIISQNESLYEKLSEAFPGYIGFSLFYAYKPFLKESLDEDKSFYFKAYIKYLDALPELPFSDDEIIYLDDISSKIDVDTLEKITNEKMEAISSPDSWYENNKEFLDFYMKYKVSSDYMSSPMFVIQEKIKTYFVENHYYEKAIPLIRKFSPSYDDYYIKLQEASKILEDKIK